MPCNFTMERPPPFQDIPKGCQFSVPESELVRLGTGPHCIFHIRRNTNDEFGHRKEDWSQERVAEFRAKLFDYIDAALSTGSPVDLSGVSFPDGISFEAYRADRPLVDLLAPHAEFGVGTSFKNVWLKGRCRFDRTSFAAATTFESARIPDSAIFAGATFLAPVWFNNAVVGRRCSFAGAKFPAGADLRGIEVGGATTFERSIFEANSRWDGARIGTRCTFYAAAFKTRATFDDVVFGWDDPGKARGRIHLSCPKDADAAHRTFGALSFRRARFETDVRFNNREFLDTADFSDAVFRFAPEFHSCKLHEDTRFPEDGGFMDVRSGGAVAAYRTLKLAMEQLREHKKQGLFFALEQRARRHRPGTPWHEKLASLLYDGVSNYGRDFFRPLVLLIAGTGLAFPAAYEATAWAAGISAWGQSVPFSMQQVFKPFEVWSSRYDAQVAGMWATDMLMTHPFWLRLMATAESLLSLSFVALFLLAIRRRFKLD